MGQFTLYTYVRPFLEVVTQVDGVTLSYILLVLGLAGLVGTMLVNIVLENGFYPTLIGIPILMAATAVSLIYLGNWTAAVTALLGLWG